MLRAPRNEPNELTVGDAVAIWCDASGWLAPCRVTHVVPYHVEIAHNGRLKTSILGRTRKIIIEDSVEGRIQVGFEETDTLRLPTTAATDGSSAYDSPTGPDSERTQPDEQKLDSSLETSDSPCMGGSPDGDRQAAGAQTSTTPDFSRLYNVPDQDRSAADTQASSGLVNAGPSSATV